MTYTEREQLTVIELQNYEESVSMEEVKKMLADNPSNMIYCEIQKKLVGIISTGDIFRAYVNKQNQVNVNKKFTYLFTGEYMRARTIFMEKVSINALPVITKENTLIGEYMRWDDLNLLEYGLNIIGKKSIANFIRESRIVLVRPCTFYKRKIFEKYKEYIQLRNEAVECIDHLDVPQYLETADEILFIDENERRACDTLLIITFNSNYCGREKLKTYKKYLDIAGIMNEQCALYLKDLCEKGVNILGLMFDTDTRYYKHLSEKVNRKFVAVGEEISWKLPKTMYKDFFDDLYEEEYIEQILQIPFEMENREGVFWLKDCRRPFYNVMNGERYTINQPKSYERSIYFYGPCYVCGHYVEDKNTIESFLQTRLCDEESAVKVINGGCIALVIGYRWLPRIAVTKLKKGDILVIDRPPEGIEGVKYLDLIGVLENGSANANWIVDTPFHCNHKVNKLWAEAVYEILKPVLAEKVDEQAKEVEKDLDFIKMLYIDGYFADFDSSKYDKIGSIVMNCNPFTYGHLSLIERALRNVDFLIIFVVEEDKSIFPFVERFKMVKMGCEGMKNVMVVPSGPFILSQWSFPEYFIKETSEDIVEHTEQDITTFAKNIAPHLGIKYRFVGEEPEDAITNQYNRAMKKILPKYGIELIELSRKTVNGRYISASSARKYMDENNYDALVELLPETTRRYLGIP